MYGAPAEVPIYEDLPKDPINPYGHSKWAVERMCSFLSQTGRLRYAALRYFNACGAGDNASLGEDHRPESHLIPLVIQAAMGKRPSELAYNLGNGKAYSVREVIETVRRVSRRNFRVVEVDPRPGDPPVLTADASRARGELGWSTDFPELEKIVESAWIWHNKYPNGYSD